MTTHTTRSLLTTLANRAEQALQPEARGKATAATLHELVQIPLLPEVGAADLIGALITLGRDLPGDEAPIAARRKTCRELADLACSMSIAAVTLPALLLWWAFGRIRGQGPRIAAIKATARRELVELVNMAEPAIACRFTGTVLEMCDTLEADLEAARARLPGDGALHPVPSRREPGGIVVPPRPSAAGELSDEEVSRRIAAALEAAKVENLASAWLDLGLERGAMGREYSPLVARTIAALRAGGYPGASLDGRSGLIEIPLG